MTGIFNFMKKPKKFRFEITQEQAEQTAQIVDRECWISMTFKGGGFGLAFRFRRDELDELIFLHQLFGGYLGKQEVVDEATVYWLSIQQGRALSFLWTIDPYIKRRRKSFELVKALRASIDGNRQRKLSDEAKEYRIGIVEELYKLNKAFFEWRKTHDPLDFSDLAKGS